jgi:hypothetical protein
MRFDHGQVRACQKQFNDKATTPSTIVSSGSEFESGLGNGYAGDCN